MTDLGAVFAEQLAPEHRAKLDAGRVELLLLEAREEAEARWRGVAVEPAEFAAYAGRAAAAVGAASAPRVAEMWLVDLYLACACVRGKQRAIAALRTGFFGDVQAALRGLGVAPDAIDELEQDLLEVVLSPRAGRVLLADYRGRGPLRRWLRSIAVRRAAKRFELEQRHAENRRDLEDVLHEEDDDIETAHFKDHYTADYRAAMSDALEELSAAERNILRQYFIDGLTIDELASLYGIHRSTAARRVVSTKERVLAGAVDRLRVRLGMSQSEVTEVGHLLRSKLELSFERLLS